MGTNYIFFELNCSYYPYVFFKDDVDSCLKSYSVNKLAKELRDLIVIC